MWISIKDTRLPTSTWVKVQARDSTRAEILTQAYSSRGYEVRGGEVDRYWRSEENTFLWDARQKKVDWEKIAERLGKTVGACKSHYARMRRRRKFAAQRDCAEAGHIEFGDGHCAVEGCTNHHKNWS